MHFTKRTLPIVMLFGIVLVLLMSLGVSAQASSFTVGMPAPVQLDPALGTNDQEVLINRAIYDYLVDIAPDGSLVPNLATEWEISEDGLTYTFSLVEGVTFHDGTPFSSADVVYTFNRLAEVGSPAVNLLGEFSVEAPDESTVVFTVDAPNADFLFGVASRWSLILKDGMETPNVLSEGDNPLENFVGTGAFVLTEFNAGESVVFEANGDYWIEGQPGLDSMTFVFFESADAEINALRSGTVDFIFKVAIDRAEELEAEEGINVVFKATNLHPVIRIRSDEGYIGEDVRVRQAFKYATDRELLNLDLFDGRAAVGNNDPIGPLYGPFFDDSIENQEYDPERACELLAEAGYPDGLGADEPLTFYVVDAFNYADMAISLRDQWAEGCIYVEILVRPENVYYGDNEWLEVELGVTGWGSRPIPQQYLLEAYISTGSFNEAHWSDEELDALILEASVTADLEERAAIYSQIAQIFAERGPVIIPFFAPIIGAYTDSVEGLNMHPFPGRTDFRSVTVSG